MEDDRTDSGLDGEMAQEFAYCFYTRGGRERRVASILRKTTVCSIYCPSRIVREKRRGIWRDVSRPLIPGYLFLFGHIRERDIYWMYGFGHFVRDIDGFSELHGSDLEYANWVRVHGGVIGVSRALTVGEDVKIIDGPLKDFTGSILRFDRHKRRAVVRMILGGTVHDIQLSLEDVTWETDPVASLRPQEALVSERKVLTSEC